MATREEVTVIYNGSVVFDCYRTESGKLVDEKGSPITAPEHCVVVPKPKKD